MSLFDASDVLRFAMQMEENGGRFYREAADRSKKSEVKKLFNFLAAEEAKHKKTFEDLLSKEILIEPPEDYPGQYLSFLQNYIDGKIFAPPDEKSAKTESGSVANSLDYAIRREMESIHYYQELKAFLHVDDHSTLDKIINEERKHFMQLTETKNNLT